MANYWGTAGCWLPWGKVVEAWQTGRWVQSLLLPVAAAAAVCRWSGGCGALRRGRQAGSRRNLLDQNCSQPEPESKYKIIKHCKRCVRSRNSSQGTHYLRCGQELLQG